MPDTERKPPRCIAPFLSIASWADGETVICCEDKGTLVGRLDAVDELAELVNSPRMRETRRQFLNGETPPGCEFCLRESELQPTIHHYYQEHFDWSEVVDAYDFETGTVGKTRYLLIALSNLCTYSCRMCFDKLSTRLSLDRHQMFGTEKKEYKPNNIDKVIRFVRANPIRIVTFHGGNPIHEPRFLEVLAELADETTVEILTNGSTLTSAGRDIRPHLERFKHVRFNLSLDGTRRVTEYIRVHSDFDTVYRSFTEMKELPNASVNLHNTITNLNLFDLSAYYTMTLWGKFAAADAVSSYIATEPEMLRVSNLPNELRRQASDRLEDFLRATEHSPGTAMPGKFSTIRKYVRNVLHRLEATPYDPRLFADFLQATKTSDSFYGFDPLPEYSYYLAAGAPSAAPLVSAPSVVALPVITAPVVASHPSETAGCGELPSETDSSPPAPDASASDAPRQALLEVPYPPLPPCPYVGERSFNVSECTFGWTARFHQNCTAVTVRIQLNPDPGITPQQLANLQTTWANGIVNKWSGQFSCTNPYGSSLITFAVQWVQGNAHHVVRVRQGAGQTNMTTWHTVDSGHVAAHEFGHMLGNPDEYTDTNCPNRSPVSTGTVMDNNVGPALQRHVDRICSSAGFLSDEHFSIGLDLI